MLKFFLLFIEAIYLIYSYICIRPYIKNLSLSSQYPLFLLSNQSNNNIISVATKYLNLPVWSRNFVSCASPKSEINCNQIIKAYQTIKKWNDVGPTRPIHRAVHAKPRAGIGNGLYHILTGLIVAISLNRSVQLLGGIDGLEYNPLLNQSQDLKCKTFGHWPIMNQEYWERNTYESLKEAQAHITSSFVFPYFLLTEPGFSNFIYQHFGIHFAYFVLNFAVKFSQKTVDYVNSLIGSIPSSVKIIGLHIRTHKSKQEFYIYNEDKVRNAIIPFLNQLLENKNYVAIATDWNFYTNLFQNIYSKRLIIADVMRKPDGDMYGASIDVRLLMSCNKMIGTYRSTFSSIAGMCAMHKIFYVSMMYPSVFQFTNSQAGLISGIYEDVKDFSYFVNQRLKLNPITDDALRSFFRNVVY